MTDREGRSQLHYVAIDHPEKEHVAVARRLVAEGADPTHPDDAGRTPLHFAAQEGATDLADYLLSLGIPVDPRDSNGNTPLSNAVFACVDDGAMIQLLRQRGADPHAGNDHGVTPVGLARNIANHPVAQFFDDLPEG